jgi:hypothetical protein
MFEKRKEIGQLSHKNLDIQEIARNLQELINKGLTDEEVDIFMGQGFSEKLKRENDLEKLVRENQRNSSPSATETLCQRIRNYIEINQK